DLRHGLAVVGEQPLAHELEQDVVVALEGGVDVEVLSPGDEAVLRHVARPAARLAGLLERLQREPRRRRLERRGEGLEVLARLVVVVLAAEYLVETLEEALLGEGGGVGAGDERQEAALVALVVEEGDLATLVGAGELAALVAVAHRDGQCGLAHPDRGAAEGDAALDQRAEHGEEAPTLARDR